jgi:hypothetical protein
MCWWECRVLRNEHPRWDHHARFDIPHLLVLLSRKSLWLLSVLA